MNKTANFIRSISGLLIFIAIAVIFPDIFLYFVISLVLFLLCSPLAQALGKVKIEYGSECNGNLTESNGEMC